MCDKDCYPPGEKRDSGDWASRDAVCASGLTYMNVAEAAVSRRKKEKKLQRLVGGRLRWAGPRRRT